MKKIYYVYAYIMALILILPGCSGRQESSQIQSQESQSNVNSTSLSDSYNFPDERNLETERNSEAEGSLETEESSSYTADRQADKNEEPASNDYKSPKQEATTKYEKSENNKESAKDRKTANSGKSKKDKKSTNDEKISEGKQKDSHRTKQKAKSEAIEQKSDKDSTVEESTMKKMTLQIGKNSFTATLESNEAVNAFVKMMNEKPVVIQMNDYSGFEKVGSLGVSLPADDKQTTTKSGDIVLYNGNQIVIFYGSNSWSYTRIGRIDDLSGWKNALGSGDVTVTFSLK